MKDDDDTGLLRLWRDQAHETPDALLDHRILNAAQIHRQRRRLLPLAGAMAACLVLGLVMVRLQPVAKHAPAPAMAAIDTSTFGLYEGREFAALAAPAAASPQAAVPTPAGLSRR